jgi:hypothetical protein
MAGLAALALAVAGRRRRGAEAAAPERVGSGV